MQVTREQIEREMERLRERSGEEVLLGEVLLPVDSPAEEARVLQQARELVAALREGADFRALASQVSASPSARDGGEVGWLRVEDLVPALQSIVRALEPGQVSDPVRTPEGFRIFTVFERRQATADPAADVVEIAQIVFPLRPDPDPREVEGALRRARAVLPRLASCSAVQAVATELRAPASGRLGWVRLSDLPPDFRAAVERLRPGEASQPLRGPIGIHVLYLCARGGEEGLRALARLEIVRRELERLAARYLRDLRRSAYIDVRI
ncbi:Chaperone SurA [bacterium HR39]|nr:Chaperone SurA [bacterium HR39]